MIRGVRLRLSGALLAATLLIAHSGFYQAAAQPARRAPAAAPAPMQCPPLPTFIARLGQSVPDLGGAPLVDERDSPVAALGERECPTSSATQCDKLVYFSFMLALLDMSPATYRRHGIAAFMANLTAEDAGMGSACSAEGLRYGGLAIRDGFAERLQRYFCSPTGPGFATGQRANWVAENGRCDTSDEALARLRDAIVAENPTSLTSNPLYSAGTFGPIVIRVYRYKFNEPSDTEAYRFRGRGFIQITSRENYGHCQRDIELAAAYLRTNQEAAAAARAVTRIDWLTLNILQYPEAVSENRFVAAFCAASYWNKFVARTEMVLPRREAESSFARIVGEINEDRSKPAQRLPQFTRWCEVAACQRNYPENLNMAAGFQAIIRFRRSGFSER